MTAPCTRCAGSGIEPDPVVIGRRVRAVRMGQDLTLHLVANLLNCSVQHVSDLERGNKAWYSPTARAYLRLLELKADGS